MTARVSEARRLDRDILAAIARGWADPLTEEEFDALAKRLFSHQLRHNPVARDWWCGTGVKERDVGGWREIPPLPVVAYKRRRVASFPARAGRDTGRAGQPRFLSSGTTAKTRSRVFVESLDLYRAAILPPFRRYCLPDRGRMRLLFLAPPAEDAPRSSLSFMFEVLRAEFGETGSAFCAGVKGLRMRELQSHFASAAAEREPLFLLGPVFAFVHALDVLRELGMRFELAEGSRVFQTGGFKGRSRVIAAAELEAGYAELLGLPPERIVNEYGMAELASQFYAGPDGRYAGPPWVRWRVLEPLTLEPAADGTRGVLAVWDLANRSHCFTVRTEDLAVARGGTFELLGRVAAAEPRGCSLEADLPFEPALSAAGPHARAR